MHNFISRSLASASSSAFKRSLPSSSYLSRSTSIILSTSQNGGTERFFSSSSSKKTTASALADEEYDPLPWGLSAIGEKILTRADLFKSLSSETVKHINKQDAEKQPYSKAVQNEIANIVFEWATRNGASSFAHYGSPIRGPVPLIKHDSFIKMNFKDGTFTPGFEGSRLFLGETDGSSFPNGGLRATHTAGAYLTWDVQSPLFIRGDTLLIPSGFVSFNGDALDEKTPLLRSQDAVSNAGSRLLPLLGEKDGKSGIICNNGWEQEFFLVDHELYLQRPDLMTSGRSLIGAPPPRGQQTSVNYFAKIPARSKRVLESIQKDLLEMGISLAVYHNEVAPSQVEISPVFTASNIASDTNLIAMDVIRDAARREGMVALFHEKPFKNINGSGKHCNWGLNVKATGRNLFVPGSNEQEQTTFIALVACLMRSINLYGDTIRVGVASAGNDHRLGAHEAPPAIISLYLGKGLGEHIEKIAKQNGELTGYGVGERILSMGTSALKNVKTSTEDRNRTAPFPFCGNRFELRAVGSDMNTAFPVMIVQTAMAESMNELAKIIESKSGSVKEAVREMLNDNIRVMFNGNGYSEEWHKEAEKRGLPNLRDTVSALSTWTSEKNIKLFESMKVLRAEEVKARQNIHYENYTETIIMEANCLLDMMETGIIPACAEDLKQYQGVPASLVGGRAELYDKLAKEVRVLQDLVGKFTTIEDEGKAASAKYAAKVIKPQMSVVRTLCDDAERLMRADLYPYPTYQSILFAHHEEGYGY